MKLAQNIEIPMEKDEAATLQMEYASQVITENTVVKKPKLIAGTDVCYGNTGEKAYAAIAVMDLSTGKIVDTVTWVGAPPSSYRPGFFSMRECPCLLKAFEKLQTIPDVVLIDGNGLIHPRRFGLACHVGLCLGLPTIGCAKSLFIGKCEPVSKKNKTCYVHHEGEKIGVAIKVQSSTIYVSIGHKVDLKFAQNLVIEITESFGVTPIDYAHDICSYLYKEDKKNVIDSKGLAKEEAIKLGKELKSQGLSYREVASKLNENEELKKTLGRKFTPRRIRNWLEHNMRMEIIENIQKGSSE